MSPPSTLSPYDFRSDAPAHRHLTRMDSLSAHARNGQYRLCAARAVHAGVVTVLSAVAWALEGHAAPCRIPDEGRYRGARCAAAIVFYGDSDAFAVGQA